MESHLIPPDVCLPVTKAGKKDTLGTVKRASAEQSQREWGWVECQKFRDVERRRLY